MFDTQTYQTHHGQDALHSSSFMFTGSYDDSSFCRGSQCLKPIATSFPTKVSTVSNHKHSSLTTSPAYHSESEDCAVLDDDDEFSEDELPTSPKRRHSGAISIRSEDLPFCYDREAMRRDTAAHRARHQRHMQRLMSGTRVSMWVTPEKREAELEGSQLALRKPEKSKIANCERTEVEQFLSPPMSLSRTVEQERLQQVSKIDGPMMALWGV